jgi:hypothetical protein
MLPSGDRVGTAMWSNTGGGRSASRGAGGRFGQRRTRSNGQRGYASVAVIVAVLVLAACYSAIEVATKGRPDPTPARQIAGAAHVLDGEPSASPASASACTASIQPRTAISVGLPVAAPGTAPKQQLPACTLSRPAAR